MNRLFVLGLIACVGCGPKKDSTGPTETPPVVVTVAPLKTQTVHRSVSVVGTLNGFEDVTLAPKVDGRVIAIRADVGDVVSPGATLMELETADYALSITEAKQALYAELAKLGLTALPAGELDVETVPAVRKAAVAVEDASRKFKQKTALLRNAAVSKEEYDVAETEVRLAEATKAQVVTDAKAILAAARLRKASLDLAEQKLRDCKLIVPTPPQAGMKYAVAERMLSEGTMVRSMPVTNAFRLVLAHELKLRVMVPERYAAEVKVGQTAAVLADAVPGKTFTGKVARINPTVDSANRTFSVEVLMPNPDGTLKCGGFAKAAIQTRVDANVPTVPPESVVTFAGVNKIFLVENGKARAVEVQLGTREKDWVEVLGQLPPTGSVVTSGQTQLVNGSVVKVREEETAR